MEFDKQQFFIKQYFQLEDMLFHTSRYVAFDKNNLKTFSLEYMTIIFQSCSAIESLIKEIFGIQKGEETTIENYCKLINENEKYANLLKTYLSFDNFEFYPFANFFKPVGQNKDIVSPSWWSEYQKIKHDQYKNFKLANMKNAISCLGAFYQLLRMEDMARGCSTILNLRTMFSGMGNCVDRKYTWNC